MPSRVPDPPDDLAARVNIITWISGRRLVRCFNSALHGPEEFNPGLGQGGRFHFFEDDHGTTVPILYAADSFESAIAETIFHDVPLRGRRFVAGHKLVHRRVVDLELGAGPALELVQL